MPPPSHNPKKLGERAEFAFIHQAIERGFTVARPFGDSARYDVILDPDGRCLHRVQVRSVYGRSPTSRSYKIDCRAGSRRLPFTPAEFDFLAAWVAPERIWYIIPIREFAPCNHISLFPHVKHSTARFEHCREAWHLLRP